MESSLLVAVGSALWLGVLTSISPCTLTTNIAAVSFVSKNVDATSHAVFSGVFYAVGRMLVYLAISAIVVGSVVSVPALSMFLQTKINVIVGPILVVAGLILLNIIKLPVGNNKHSQRAAKFADRGYAGSLLVGFLFALAFCPVSAALFFGSMLPMSISHKSYFIIPAVYGVGTALPVVVFAILLATGTQYVAAAFHKLTAIEIWVRRITAIVFILIGIYFVITYIFKVQIF